ncbi:hypothetical protein [Nitrosomonas sp. Nm33]|uniref:hypothetical protein n=1 Tax=Nitrosomonas sp. Nm33 TaxID=133724 RepID=UPI00089A8D65|nr:hypothetical protein [Nitrosomonas sp. Nm33]SDY74617.1 hypothetical protein SAMN05421755_104424 [Nitrosomonas sp. Nm33]
MSYVLKGFSKVLNLWPDVDYFSYIPTKTASSEAWRQVGDDIAKIIVVEALKLKISDEELSKLARALEELDSKSSERYLR